MNLSSGCPWTAALAAGTALLLNVGLTSADSVKLDGGGALNGSVTTGAKAVSVRTSSGAVIVVERTAVRQVTHGRGSVAMTASNSANSPTKGPPKNRKLRAEEDAWMPKVRQLVGRLFAGDREKSRRAQTELTHIDDTDAIPALSTYLGSSRNGEARRLYLVIVHNMPGPKPVYYLVTLSLVDPSPEIRAEARKALRDDQLDSARRLYIAALRFGPPSLARLAAIGLGEVGDPRGESVPYLIDALVSYGTVSTMRASAHSDVLYSNTIYGALGLNLTDANPSHSYAGQTTGASTQPDSTEPVATSDNPVAAAQPGVSASGQPLPGAGTVPGQVGGQAVLMPNSTGTTSCQTGSGPSASGSTLTESDLYDPPHQCCCKHDRPLRGYVDHPEVLDALLKVTGQPYPGYGFNRDRWRSWWANEKTNRDMQPPSAPDHVLTADRAAK